MSIAAQQDQIYVPTIILKVSSQCNLACEYCVSTDLLKKKSLMSIDLFSQILSNFVPYFAKKGFTDLELVFHGGEPLLAGHEFYRKIPELESAIDTADLLIYKTIQTNGTLIAEDWIELLKQGKYRIGLSVDGPAALHDRYRKDHHGKPTFNRVAQSIEMLQEENIPLGLLSVVTESSPPYCNSFFDLLMEWNISSIDLLPCIGPSGWKHTSAYSIFARNFFDKWLENDFPFHVLTFLDILRKIGGEQAKLCDFAEMCGKFLFIDTLGRIYPCDECIGDEKYHIGTVSLSSFELDEYRQDRLQKRRFPACPGCAVNSICSGGCPTVGDANTGRDLYCSARKALILHILHKIQEYFLSPKEILQRFDRKTIQRVDTVQWTNAITF
ncbi:MAG: radical SAM protein [Candidatus Hodarchaeota archaeon]